MRLIQALVLVLMLPSIGPAATLDLGDASVVSPAANTASEDKAVAVLVEEIQKRTLIRLPRANAWPSEPKPVIAVGRADALQDFAGRFAAELRSKPKPEGAEGYRIEVKGGASPAVFVIGNDSRGVLFGVGHLLRTLRMQRGSITLAADFAASTAPAYPLRGHQLGFRPKTNSYDGWTVEMWDQYIRDLAIFGTNAVELIPPRSDDAPDSPHFPLPQIEMMAEMSRILDEYGLDVWIWYPALDEDYGDPAMVEFALNEWGEVFKRLPRVDAVFVPGGDPGHTQPKHLMALLEKQRENLRRYHPDAEMWMSPQSFSGAWLEEFFDILDQEPDWLAGIVFGPQTSLSLPDLRARVPKRYPIRRYPDITHSRHCQYPVPDWDLTYALTEAREVINPRPLDQAVIFRALEKYSIGFLTYSEGCNDDVNKFVWSGLGWNPKADVRDILRAYGRYFIGDDYSDGFAQGLLALEENWRGPLLANEGVYTTLQRFQTMERHASPQLKLNWRFQQALYRAHYDAYNRGRLLHETSLEEQALGRLRAAGEQGSLRTMADAEQILDQAVTAPVSQDWRARIFELAEALYQSVRMQLSVPRYQAIRVGRGANLDTVDLPLNNRVWLKSRFVDIRRQGDEAERLQALHEIVDWTNPGPGGYYDDLGNLSRQPHLVRGMAYGEDPAHLARSLVGFGIRGDFQRYPVSWWRHAESLNDAPLQLQYDNLDPEAAYKVRVVYAGDSPKPKISLSADDGIDVHPLISRPVPFRPVEFDVPPRATADGELTLTWRREPGLGGNGRGNQIAEVWLIKKDNQESKGDGPPSN